MAIKIQNTADIEFVGVKCIIYGGAGVGKTRTIATAMNIIKVPSPYCFPRSWNCAAY